MVGWLALIPAKWKLWALVAAAFVLGVFGLRAMWVDGALARAEAERAKARLRAVKESKDVREDVEILDDSGLSERASRWLREKP